DVQKRFLQLAGAFGRKCDFGVCPRTLLKQARELDHRRADSSPDVEAARIDSSRRWRIEGRAQIHRVRDVANIDVVASLLTVSENRQRLSLQEPTAKDRNHSGLTMRVLPGAIHISEAHRHVLESMQATVVREVILR